MADTIESTEQCPRVKARIECPECGYPAGEAMYAFKFRDHEQVEGIAQDIYGYSIADPGCFPNKEG